MMTELSSTRKKIELVLEYFGLGSLHLNAFALIGGNIFIAAGGYLYWVIAARRFSENAVGVASAVLSAMLLIGLITDLGLGVGLIRYLPDADRENRGSMIINTAVTMRVAVILLVSLIFLAGIPVWAPGLFLIFEQLYLWLLFLSLVVLNGLFTLLNFVFIAMRAAKYVLMASIIFTITKLGLVAIAPVHGEIISLIMAVVVALLITLVLSISILMPQIRPDYLPKLSCEFCKMKMMISYSASNQIANIFLGLPQMLLPLMVLNYLGSQANARFYMAFMTANLLRTAGVSISQSTFAEGVNDFGNLKNSLIKSFQLNLIVTVFGGTIIYTVAPWILLIFGKSYSTEGTDLLQWLIISTLPFNLINIAFIWYRVRKDTNSLILSSIIWVVFCLFGTYIGLISGFLKGAVIGWTLAHLSALLVLGVILLVQYLRVIKYR